MKPALPQSKNERRLHGKSGIAKTIPTEHQTNLNYLKRRTITITTITSFDQLPITLCAEQVAQVLGISRSNAYALFHREDFPTIRIGKRMLVAKDKLMQWMDESAQ